VRSYRDKNGLRQRWLTEGEIDDIVEGELGKAGLMPTIDNCRVNIDGFVEHHLQAFLDVGATLDADVLGVTELRPGEPARILINRELTDAACEVDEYSGTLGRWRATVAHEGSHVLLHRPLFELNVDQQSLFGDDVIVDDPVIRCYKRETSFGGRSTDPREWQANKGMAALLMPRSVFGEAARIAVSTNASALAIVEGLARRFEVSREATRIRLSTLGFLDAQGAPTAGIFS
jgi:hypothetical protein